MKRLSVSFVVAVTAMALVTAGCTQTAPAPTPTKAPVVPTKAAEPTKAPPAAPVPTKATEPTKAPTAAPTAAPAKKVDFPEKGKAITLVVAWPAGGGTDLGARVLAANMEKELGTPVQVVNKAGAAGQVGITEVLKSKADGYTLAAAPLPTVISLYLDPERKAVFGRKDIQPLALQVVDAGVIGVKADSPYKSVKDLIDAAKAQPEKIKVADAGVKSAPHLAAIQLQKLANAKFAVVHFDGFAPAQTALLGGHVDAQFAFVGEHLAQVRSGNVRILGVMDKEESKFLSGVKTVEAQGYKIYMASSRGYILPSGTPKEVVDILANAIKKAMDTGDHKTKMEEMGLAVRYLDPTGFTQYWDDLQKEITPLMDLAGQ